MTRAAKRCSLPAATALLLALACSDSTGPRWVELLRAEPDSAHLIVGESAVFTARVFDQRDDPMPAEWVPRVHWDLAAQTGDATLDTLESGVEVTAVAPGTVVLKAELGRGRKDIPVFVRTADLDHVAIEPDSILTSTVAETQRATVHLFNASGEELAPEDYRISWTTTDTTVAVVSRGGIPPWRRGVHAVRHGQTKLKAIVNDVVGFADVYAVEVPLRPDTVGVTTLSATSLRVTWGRTFGTNRGYRVYRSSTSGSGYAHIASPGENSGPAGQLITTYDDTGLQPGTTYFYVVEACNASGCSERSPEGSGTTADGGG